MNKHLAKKSDHVPLLTDIQHLINQARQKVASVVNAELTMLYWKVGYRINKVVFMLLSILQRYLLKQNYRKSYINLSNLLDRDLKTRINEQKLSGNSGG